MDYTSTQWDSDEEDETESEDEEPVFAARRPVAVMQAKPGSVPPAPSRPGFPTPQSRQQQQPSPAPRQQVKTVISKPLNDDDDDDDDDWLDSDRYCLYFFKVIVVIQNSANVFFSPAYHEVHTNLPL